ncbi:hypothetical protein fHeYen902_104c [Yersinia phage fHe-Yen9-02]|nr:hypothetical protein fHeYen902_104c [Yersinia phage fHe-Yen9-02]
MPLRILPKNNILSSFRNIRDCPRIWASLFFV